MINNETFRKKKEESVMLHAVNTDRIQAIPAQIDHLEVVELVFRENHETCALLSAHPDSHTEALSLVTYAELPPDGLVENLRNFVLFERESDQPMGILSLYLGYPEPCVIHGCWWTPFVVSLSNHDINPSTSSGRTVCTSPYQQS